jgi:hypothetical protein
LMLEAGRSTAVGLHPRQRLLHAAAVLRHRQRHELCSCCASCCACHLCQRCLASDWLLFQHTPALLLALLDLLVDGSWLVVGCSVWLELANGSVICQPGSVSTVKPEFKHRDLARAGQVNSITENMLNRMT